MKHRQTLTEAGRSRRSLLTGWFGRNHSHQTRSPLPVAARPPQALPEALFSALCNGCSACVAACPYGLLSIEQSKATLHIDFTACDGCQRCTAVCQTGALRTQMPSDTLLRPQISLSCLGQQDSCRMCVINCPQQALVFTVANAGDTPRLQCDNERCNGCGECKLSCFHGHISLAPSAEKSLPERL